jgi:hypothetical protein
MKQETNNEIDLLLRRLSRRQGASLPDAESHSGIDHLDADELSSYAENALPAAARVRYTEHLAECSKCRELVVQLSSSVGFARAEEISRASEPSGLRKFLANLFSPMVLRFAVPALGLIVVAAIGFAVFRTNRQAADVVALRSEPAGTLQPETPLPATTEHKENAGAPAATSESRSDRSKQTQAPAPDAPPPASGFIAPKQEEPLQKAEDQPVANTAPSQPAPAPAAAVDESKRKVETETQGRVAATTDTARENNFEVDKGERRRSEDAAASGSAPAKARAQTSDLRALEGGATTGGLQRDGIERNDKDDAETRSVAGRRFRKQGGIWIDTAYDRQSAFVNLTRGSEQYRALVADEPAIRTISEQLDGQIIVVWKGRTYRIR